MSANALAERLTDLRNVNKQQANPLDVVPDSYLEATVRLWGRNHYHIQNPLALATRLRDWIDEDGLTPAEWADIVRKASRPERQAGIDTCPKFMADLAALVVESVRRREQAAELGRLRQREESDRAGALPGPQVRELLTAGIGRTPPE